MKPSQLCSEEILVFANPHARDTGSATTDVSELSVEHGRRVRVFHKTLPGYAMTPLVALPGLSAHLGVRNIWIKDESHRFGLNAFKVLGASYGVAATLADKAALATDDVTFESMRSATARSGALTFVTATDGNHGRAVAWAARELGHTAVVYLPRGSSPVRLDNIRALGSIMPPPPRRS